MAVACFVVLLTGSLVTGGAQAEAPGSDSGSLTVTARDATGALIQDGAIVLYTEDWTAVGEKEIGTDGQVQWSGLSPGTYRLELYRSSNEFWGGTEVTLRDGEQAEVTVHRTEPYMTTLEFEESEGDGTYRVGETITISPEVHSDQMFPRSVRVNISINTDGDTSPENTVFRGPLEVPSDGSRWYGYEFTPDEPGSVAVRVIVESKIGGDWVATDRMAWTEPLQIEPEETPTTEPDRASDTVPESPKPQQEPSPTTREASGPPGGFGREVYVGTGIVVAALLASLYTASKMEWTD